MNYLDYAKALNCNEKVEGWIKSTLSNYLEKNNPSQDEVEHIIDYLISDEAPKNIAGMSYKEAKTNTDKWNKTLIKKGEHIKETEKDTEVIIDFKDGFKIVKLVGKNAYEREGYLMRHCVASYYGKDTDIYSLRDKDNMPHCTIEKDQQIKGKGNGDIHPSYIDYVVKFLESINMNVGDNEMLHLGYVNIEPIIKDIDVKPLEKYLYNKKYLLKDKKDLIKDKDGNQKIDLDMLSIFPLIEEKEDTLKVAFDIPLLVSSSIEFIRKSFKKFKDENTQAGGNNSKLAGGDNSQLAGGYNSKLAGGNNSKLAGGYNSKLAGGDNSQLAGGDNSQLAGGYNSKLAGGYNSQLAGGNNSKLAGGNYSKLAGGDNSQLAGGYNSKLAGGYNSQLAGGNYSQLAGGNNSKLDIGKGGIAVGDNGSQAKGKIGACIVLCERDEEHNLIKVVAEIIDGEKLKEDVYYKLEKGKLIEV